MKKQVSIVFGLLAVLGIGYMTWRLSPLGKNTLNKWLLKRWKELAKKNLPKKEINWERVQTDLNKFDYETHELLYFYTKLDVMGSESIPPAKEKKLKKLLSKLKEKGVVKKVGLIQLEGVIFPT